MLGKGRPFLSNSHRHLPLVCHRTNWVKTQSMHALKLLWLNRMSPQIICSNLVVKVRSKQRHSQITIICKLVKVSVNQAFLAPIQILLATASHSPRHITKTKTQVLHSDNSSKTSRTNVIAHSNLAKTLLSQCLGMQPQPNLSNKTFLVLHHSFNRTHSRTTLSNQFRTINLWTIKVS